jgi:hypothetical protein
MQYKESSLLRILAFHLHQLDREPEQPAGLVGNHFKVFLFRGAGQGISPAEIQALAAVQPQHLFRKDDHSLRLAQLFQLLLSPEVGEIGRVDGLRDAENAMRDGESSS